MTQVELAARALCLAAGKDPDELNDICAAMDFHPGSVVPTVKGDRPQWLRFTREAKAVLMAVGLSIEEAA